VVAISDRRPEALARAGPLYPGAKLTDDYRELLSDPAVDAVAIATPVEAHFPIAMAALRAGKHVWIEKPMCQSSEQAARLIDESLRRHLVLLVDHTFIYTSAVRKIAEMIGKGELGDLYYYDSVRVNLGLFQRDVNVIWDLAVHDFAILVYLLGQLPGAISANGASHLPGAPENIAYITLFFGSGMLAHLNVNWLAPVKVRQTMIAGSRRMILFNDLEPSEKVKVYDRGVILNGGTEQVYRMMVDYRTGDMWAPHLSTTEALRTEADHFVACIDGGLDPITGGTMGLRVVELIEAANRSMRQRGQPIEIEPRRLAS
jgi:predicted dehydrogenase